MLARPVFKSEWSSISVRQLSFSSVDEICSFSFLFYEFFVLFSITLSSIFFLLWRLFLLFSQQFHFFFCPIFHPSSYHCSIWEFFVAFLSFFTRCSKSHNTHSSKAGLILFGGVTQPIFGSDRNAYWRWTTCLVVCFSVAGWF